MVVQTRALTDDEVDAVFRALADRTRRDIVARVINMPFEVPVSLILAMIGSVVFILLLLRQRRRA